ncbi:MAG: signal recognition particle protein Srp19, partial [Candidatus Woesearchaeota archaeon]
GKVMDMIPGFGQIKLPKDALKVQEEKIKKWKFILDSCTKEELEDPDSNMSAQRIDRISKGSGVGPGEIRELLKQYKQSKKMMKSLKGLGGGSPAQMEKMMKRMGGGMPGMKDGKNMMFK